MFKVKIHAALGICALTVISIFWTMSVIAELFLQPSDIHLVKQFILWSMIFFIPLIISTAFSGHQLNPIKDKERTAKARRMPLIALNGALILLPSAFYLEHKAAQGELDALFLTVQAIELMAGGVNIVLMTLNARDGARLVQDKWA